MDNNTIELLVFTASVLFSCLFLIDVLKQYDDNNLGNHLSFTNNFNIKKMEELSKTRFFYTQSYFV